MRVATLWTRRDLVAVEPVEQPAGLLRVDQPAVELAGVVERLTDRLGRDLVEDHALDGHPRRQHLEQVPRDRLTLAILIGCEVDLVDLLDEALQLLDLVLAIAGDDVQRLEVVVDVDAETGPGLVLVGGRDVGGVAGQVAHVADRGLHDVARAEIARDGLGLGRRLHDDEGVRHGRR
jgi:hypothetical protein